MPVTRVIGGKNGEQESKRIFNNNVADVTP